MKALPVTIIQKYYKEAEYIALTEVVRTSDSKYIPRVLCMMRTELINDDIIIKTDEMFTDRYNVSICMNDRIILSAPLLIKPTTITLYFVPDTDFVEVRLIGETL